MTRPKIRPEIKFLVPIQSVSPETEQARLEAVRLDLPKRAYIAFLKQRLASRNRGIPFELSIESWWNWWQVDDRWSRRGICGDDLNMCRFGDKGPYKLDNIYVATSRQNALDGHAKSCKASTLKTSKPVETPAGRFPSSAAAARYYGLKGGSVKSRFKAKWPGWRYLP